MDIISQTKLKEFWRKYPDAKIPLDGWLRIVRKHDFVSFAELKSKFGSIDQVGRLTVFDIGGNKYRLIAAIDRKSVV